MKRRKPKYREGTVVAIRDSSDHLLGDRYFVVRRVRWNKSYEQFLYELGGEIYSPEHVHESRIRPLTKKETGRGK